MNANTCGMLHGAAAPDPNILAVHCRAAWEETPILKAWYPSRDDFVRSFILEGAWQRIDRITYFDYRISNDKVLRGKIMSKTLRVLAEWLGSEQLRARFLLFSQLLRERLVDADLSQASAPAPRPDVAGASDDAPMIRN